MKQYVKLPPLEIDPELARALNAYAKELGVPRASVIRSIFASFLSNRLDVQASIAAGACVLPAPEGA